MSLAQLVRTIRPAERATKAPLGWLNLCLWSIVGAFFTAGVTLITAALGAVMVWRRTRRPEYRGLRTIKREQKRPSSDGSRLVEAAVRGAPNSWTVRREAGLFFLGVKDPNKAGPHLQKALELFPGNKKPYAIVLASAALDAKRPAHAIRTLEPFLASADPETSSVDSFLISLLAMAFHLEGNPGRALQVVGRLPLGRRNLDQPLLVGLCVRAMAKHDLGQKADARRDLDRVYAADPEFLMLEETRRRLGA